MTGIQTLLEAIRNRDKATVRCQLDDEPGLALQSGPNGESPVMTAIYHDTAGILGMLVARGAEIDLFAAAAIGTAARIEELLDRDPGSVASYAGDGWTALHLAAHFGHHAAAESLLARSADVHARSRNALDNTPLHAGLAGRADAALVRLLLDNGAAVDARDASGYTPLHLAASRGNLELIELLLTRGASSEHRTDAGATAAEIAAGRGHSEAAQRLAQQASSSAAPSSA